MIDTMKMKLQRVGALLISLLLPVVAQAGIPEVSHVMVTDVTTVSFSAIWIASEPSTPDLQVFTDAAGSVPATGIDVEPHPVDSGNETIRTAAEDMGVMKVRVTGLEADTAYYFRLITRSKTTNEISYFPEALPLQSVTTEVRTERSEILGINEIPFSNDLIVYDCYLPDGSTFADGALLLAEVEGADYPISKFVGDGITTPAAYIDLNNLFDVNSRMTIPLDGCESITLTRYMGLYGIITAQLQVPDNNQLTEIKSPISLVSPEISDLVFDSCISERGRSPITLSTEDSQCDQLTVVWEPLDGGTIIGSGENVLFNPSAPSTRPACNPYRIKVTVTSDVSGLSTSQEFAITVKRAGDVNGDGVVNIIDKVIVRDTFGQRGALGWIDADVNYDGFVNILDKVIVRDQFGMTGCACQ